LEAPQQLLNDIFNNALASKGLKVKKCLINFESCESVNATGFNYLSGGYDQMKCREILAKMIIAHELPLSFVEYHWFNI
jgi:hypothetical protein